MKTAVEFDEDKLRDIMNAMGMKPLQTIQTENNLNDVFAVGHRESGGARHHYVIIGHGTKPADMDEYDFLMGDDKPLRMGEIFFQSGPRNSDTSIHGVLDTDLLEIVRDRLTDFQTGPYPSPETADALRYVTEALLCLNRRTQDRAARGVLGHNTP